MADTQVFNFELKLCTLRPRAPHFPHPPAPGTLLPAPLYSAPLSLSLLDVTYEWEDRVFVFLCLISLSTGPRGPCLGSFFVYLWKAVTGCASMYVWLGGSLVYSLWNLTTFFLLPLVYRLSLVELVSGSKTVRLYFHMYSKSILFFSFLTSAATTNCSPGLLCQFSYWLSSFLFSLKSVFQKRSWTLLGNC